MASTENEYADMERTKVGYRTGQWSDKIWRYAFIVTVVVNVLAIITLVTLHIYSQLVDPSEPPDQDLDSLSLSEDLCIPCQEESALYDYRLKTTSNKYLCCYNNTDIQRAVHFMLKEERRFITEFDDGQNYKPRKDNTDLSWWRSRPSAAHLHLDTAGNMTPLKWVQSLHEQGSLTSFVSDGIKVVDDNKIEVSERGMYFIYSTISVEFRKVKRDKPDKSFYHTIQRSNVGLPNTGATIEMMRKYGGIPSQENDKLYTSFLCGALFLRSRDQLASVFDDPSLIYKFPYANYFGIFKLSNGAVVPLDQEQWSGCTSGPGATERLYLWIRRMEWLYLWTWSNGAVVPLDQEQWSGCTSGPGATERLYLWTRSKGAAVPLDQEQWSGCTSGPGAMERLYLWTRINGAVVPLDQGQQSDCTSGPGVMERLYLWTRSNGAVVPLDQENGVAVPLCTRINGAVVLGALEWLYLYTKSNGTGVPPDQENGVVVPLDQERFSGCTSGPGSMERLYLWTRSNGTVAPLDQGQ